MKTLNVSVSKTISRQIECVPQGPPTFKARDLFTMIVDSRSSTGPNNVMYNIIIQAPHFADYIITLILIAIGV